MTTNSFYQTMKDGTEIHVMRWIPDEEIKGVVQLSHGMSEHCLRYRKTRHREVPVPRQGHHDHGPLQKAA